MKHKKNKLVLVESEMRNPKGHFLNNLIETTVNFKEKLKIYWVVNKDFKDEGTYLPKKIKIYRSISSNKFKRKSNKFLYIVEEFFLFFLNIFQILYLTILFIKNKQFSLFVKALKTNYYLLPRYFLSFYKVYKSLKLSKNDHIFFQTARRKDIALVNFLTIIDKDHPKFHIRVMLPPKDKFKGFFYYLRLIDDVLKHRRAFIYLWSDYNFKLFIQKSVSKKGIFKSNIPWSFYNRKFKKKNHTIGYVGDARRARGFQHLPKIIKKLENHSFKFLIQFSKVADDLVETKKELYQMSRKNKNIHIIEKYSDYKDFTNHLKKIDIMPILHSSREINKITSGTMYTCIPYEIPLITPSGTTFMSKILKFKSFEKAKSLDDFYLKILKVSQNYKFYLRNMKLNSKILKKILNNDPLKKNIV